MDKELIELEPLKDRFVYFDRDLGIRFTRENLAKYNTDSLADLKNKILGEIATIKASLEGLATTANEDPGRKVRTRRALHYRSAFIQRINSEISRRNAIEKQKRIEQAKQEDLRFERAFIRVARELLPRDLYTRLRQEAQLASKD